MTQHRGLRRLLLVPLGWYRQYRGLRPDACRFSPSCSTYTYEAVEVHGSAKGLYLGTHRVLRCHPWGGQGYDAVPPKEPDLIDDMVQRAPEQIRHNHA